MLRQRTKIFSLILYFGDLTATLFAFILSYVIRRFLPITSYAEVFPFALYLDLLWPTILIWSIVFFGLGLYQSWRSRGFWRESWLVLKAVLIASLLLGFVAFALKFEFVSRLFWVLFAFLDVVLIHFMRFFIRAVIFPPKKDRFRFLLIIGTEKNACHLARMIERHKDLGLQIFGFLSLSDSPHPPQIDGYPVLGRPQDLPELLEKHVIDEVIFAISQEQLQRMEELFLLCEERGVTARVVLDFFPHVFARTHLEELDGLPLLTFSTTPRNELMLLLRRVFDIAGSLVLISLFSPIFAMVFLLIRIDSPGPAIFRQIRCGLNGRKFVFLKFRSMFARTEIQKNDLSDYNLMNGPVFKMKNDPRVTRVGRFLRKTSLDELPQLINVLRGDMSFVGPRPPLPEEVAQYQSWQRRRLSMRPGITGLWQVSGRNLIDFDQWMRLDLEYIDNWSLWLDLKILLKTIPVVLLGKGAM
ncbi:MAG: Undecaprenyl-phosphate galactose phosphotransferase [Deltaproteobacteria bacterium]|nr:Undecaprenyl-phosphate galactose phosphotransferase [Deltaproteobacteria bacterium]